jgi:hypothetical protein
MDAIRWHAKVGFTDARDEMVLGDAGFLRFFTPTFDRAGKTLSIRRSSARLPAFLFKETETGRIARPFHIWKHLIVFADLGRG